MVTEAANLIWSLQCERVIQNNDQPHTKVKIMNGWNKKLLNRVKLDLKPTDRKLGKKAISLPLVMETWLDSGVINVFQDPDRLDDSGVLVGNRSDSLMGVG